MANKFSCIIIDDEPMAIELLTDSLKSLYNNIEILGTFTSWQTALAGLRINNFDIAFIDIEMPGKSGIDLLNLVTGLSCEVIFITAYADYALNAFNLHAAGYILKPVKDITLANMMDKVLEHVELKNLAKRNITDRTQTIPAKIGIPHYKGVAYVSANDIIYIEAVNRYAQIVTSNSRILSSYNIGKFKELTENKLFYQVHRSFIVNTTHILRYENSGVIIMDDGKEIPISKNIRDEFLNLFWTISKYKEPK